MDDSHRITDSHQREATFVHCMLVQLDKQNANFHELKALVWHLCQLAGIQGRSARNIGPES
jgi:hypothetical protein